MSAVPGVQLHHQPDGVCWATHDLLTGPVSRSVAPCGNRTAISAQCVSILSSVCEYLSSVFEYLRSVCEYPRSVCGYSQISVGVFTARCVCIPSSMYFQLSVQVFPTLCVSILAQFVSILRSGYEYLSSVCEYLRSLCGYSQIDLWVFLDQYESIPDQYVSIYITNNSTQYVSILSSVCEHCNSYLSLLEGLV